MTSAVTAKIRVLARVATIVLAVLSVCPASHAVAQETGDAGSGSLADVFRQATGSAEPQAQGREDGGRASSDEPEEEEAAKEASPDDSTPRGAMKLYLEAARDGEFGKASTYLDLENSALSPGDERAASLAWRLKIVLDQTMWIDLEELSNEPEGNADDGAPGRDRLGSIETERGPVDVMLERVGSRDGLPVWRISSSTLARVPYLYQQFGYGELGQYLPEPFFTITLAGVQLWQWIGLLLLVLIVYLLSWLAVCLLIRVLRPAVRRTRTQIDDRLLEAVGAPVRAVIAVALFAATTLFLHLSVSAQQVLAGLERTAVIVATVWLVMRLADVSSEVVKRRLERRDHRAGLAVLPMGRRTFKVIVSGLAGIAIMQTLGFNVTGLIASLGIGGLAVALAAQRSLENMFAGLSLIGDQPVRVGDFCQFGDNMGWVEDIGLRSTRIRTLNRSVLSVPNSQFANLQLDNLAKRDYIRFYTVLGLRYETTADQLRHVILELRTMLIAHPQVSLEPFWRVRFIGFAAYSLNVEIFVYTRTTDYGEFMAIREDLLLRTIDIVEKSGTAIAFPSQTTYLGRDSGLNAERGDKAAERIRSMRESNDLPFPDFTSRRIGEVENSLPYPPRGAATGDAPDDGNGSPERDRRRPADAGGNA